MTDKHKGVHFHPRISAVAVIHGVHIDPVDLQLPGEMALGNWQATLEHDPFSGEQGERQVRACVHGFMSMAPINY